MRDDQLARYVYDPAAFIDRFIRYNELGRPFRLFPHQREVLKLAFAFDENGRLPWDTVIYSCPKKSGKTTINAAVTCWWGFTQEPPNELLIVANDLDQATARVFRSLVGILQRNPELAASVEIQARLIPWRNGTTATAISSDWASGGGSNHGLESRDELWAVISEAGRRLYDELTSVPTRTNSVRFASTYSGLEGESELLYEQYKLGVGTDEHPDGQGERLHPELPIYGNRQARVFVYWDHEPRMPWQTPEYYVAQRRTLRPATFLRLHENRWTAAESVFLTPDLWDGCVDRELTPLLPNEEDDVYVGGDAAPKNEASAGVGVRRDGDKLVLAVHRIWRPSPNEPLDFEQTIEQFLRDLHERYRVRAIFCDPYQLHRSIMTLKGAGLKIQEYPQTTGNVTAMGQCLYDLLVGRNLRLYPSDQLREQALSVVAVETTRGWRLAKEKASRKIDAIVALAMACVAALERPPRPPFRFWGGSAATEEELAAESKAAAGRLVEIVRRQGFWFPTD